MRSVHIQMLYYGGFPCERFSARNRAKYCPRTGPMHRRGWETKILLDFARWNAVHTSFCMPARQATLVLSIWIIKLYFTCPNEHHAISSHRGSKRSRLIRPMSVHLAYCHLIVGNRQTSESGLVCFLSYYISLVVVQLNPGVTPELFWIIC